MNPINSTPRLHRIGSERFHRDLAQKNVGRLQARLPSQDWEHELETEMQLRRMDIELIEAQRRELSPLLQDVPTDAEGFMKWFEGLREHGPGQGDALFPWLAEQATMAQMRWFLTQEVAGEAGFDDLVALTQLGLAPQPKLELARNYWDEMGRGREEGMHGLMLSATVRELGLQPKIETTVHEALALANTMLALASHRRYTYQSIGALGVVELTAPTRVCKVDEGLKRLGISAQGRRYFTLHAGLDIRHSEAWNREAIRPIVSEFPEAALAIAEGALMRLRCGERCFIRYRKELRMPTKAEARREAARAA